MENEVEISANDGCNSTFDKSAFYKDEIKGTKELNKGVYREFLQEFENHTN